MTHPLLFHDTFTCASIFITSTATLKKRPFWFSYLFAMMPYRIFYSHEKIRKLTWPHLKMEFSFLWTRPYVRHKVLRNKHLHKRKLNEPADGPLDGPTDGRTESVKASSHLTSFHKTVESQPSFVSTKRRKVIDQLCHSNLLWFSEMKRHFVSSRS